MITMLIYDMLVTNTHFQTLIWLLHVVCGPNLNNISLIKLKRVGQPVLVLSLVKVYNIYILYTNCVKPRSVAKRFYAKFVIRHRHVILQ